MGATTGDENESRCFYWNHNQVTHFLRFYAQYEVIGYAVETVYLECNIIGVQL